MSIRYEGGVGATVGSSELQDARNTAVATRIAVGRGLERLHVYWRIPDLDRSVWNEQERVEHRAYRERVARGGVGWPRTIVVLTGPWPFPADVRWRRITADIEVVRLERRSVRNRGHATDDHELHTGLGEFRALIAGLGVAYRPSW